MNNSVYIYINIKYKTMIFVEIPGRNFSTFVLACMGDTSCFVCGPCPPDKLPIRKKQNKTKQKYMEIYKVRI